MADPVASLRDFFVQMVDWVTAVAVEMQVSSGPLAQNVSESNASGYREAAAHDAEWQKHFQTNRARILHMVAQAKTVWGDRLRQPDVAQHPRAMILGAGACHDIPLHEMLDAGFQVTLVDIDRVPMERALAALPRAEQERVTLEVRDASGGFTTDLLAKTTPIIADPDATLYEKWYRVMTVVVSAAVPTPDLTGGQPVDFLISSMLVYPMAQFSVHTLEQGLDTYVDETEAAHLRNIAAAHRFYWQTLVGQEETNFATALLAPVVYGVYILQVSGSCSERGFTWLDDVNRHVFADIRRRFYGKVLAAHHRGIADFLARNPHAMVYYASDIAQERPVIIETGQQVVGVDCATPVTAGASKDARYIFSNGSGGHIHALRAFGLDHLAHHIVRSSRWVWGNEFDSEDYATEGCGYITPRRHCLMPKWRGGDIVCRTVEALEIVPRGSR